MPALDRTCPRCGSAYVYRSRTRTWWLRLLKQHTRLRRTTCGDCGRRSWYLAPAAPGEPPATRGAEDGRARGSTAAA